MQITKQYNSNKRFDLYHIEEAFLWGTDKEYWFRVISKKELDEKEAKRLCSEALDNKERWKRSDKGQLSYKSKKNPVPTILISTDGKWATKPRKKPQKQAIILENSIKKEDEQHIEPNPETHPIDTPDDLQDSTGE